MANNNINLTSLDFDSYRISLQTFLQSQAQFKDYNFAGSNLGVLLDLLSYNTYMNAFYMNMVGSEMFLDTAQMRDSVILKAKELNYLPRSFRSAQANLNLIITLADTAISYITIPKGTTFTGKIGSNNYTFSTNLNLAVPSSGNGVFYANNVNIYEGTYVTDTFVMQPSSNTERQYFTLSNPTVDTTSLNITVVENNGANAIPYFLSSTILDLTTESTVYFLQGAENSLYQIVFGDNVVGRKPADNAVIVAEYRVCNGQLPNGILNFTNNGQIAGSSNVTIVSILDANNKVIPAMGGDIGEGIESIRENAPRFYATQDRAVTVNDYESLLKINFPEIEAISVYGGEQTTPPQYGKVLIAVKLYNYDVVPVGKINEYTAFLNTRAPLTIDPVFIEPTYTYISISTLVNYNINQTTLSTQDISVYVTAAIQSFNVLHVEGFKSTLYYSKLLAAIDAAHSSIVSNETSYKAMKKIIPLLNVSSNYNVAFNMPLSQTFPPEPLNHEASDQHTLSSSSFTYNNQSVSLEDDGLGNIRIVANEGILHKTIVKVGTINYATGLVQLNSLKITEYVGDALRIYVVTENLDSTTNQNTIYEIPNDEINVSVNVVRQ